MTFTITTQAEYNALPERFEEFTLIEIRSDELITINRVPINSRVVAWESSSVVARGSSSVVALGSSRVVALGSSRVEAWESSSVVAWESSSVVAWESSRVEARESSSVVAWESSSVVARGLSTNYHRSAISPKIHGHASCYHYTEYPEPEKMSDGATIIKVVAPRGNQGWLDKEGLLVVNSHIIIFKRVSRNWLTQEGTQNETSWEPGKTLTHNSWDPYKQECGEGKYHACSRPYFCDEFRDNLDDRYVAIKVNVADIHAWDNAEYPHKIAFRACTVLYECDRWGDEIAGKV